MIPISPPADIAHTIQLAVAPVFLLTGVGAILSVLTNRLARIIDRSRVLHQRLDAPTPAASDTARAELSTLALRGRQIQRAIGLCTCSALLICAVVAVLFLAEFTARNLGLMVAVLFVLAMACLFVALLCFLREIFLAMANVHIGP